MYDVIHVDEKWFYIHQVASTFILAEDEEAPHITFPNKRFITKVMFFVVVARPLYDYGKGRGFDGKIGIFPIVSEREGKRTTKTQTKGDVITVPLSVNKEVYYNMLMDEVMATIRRV